MIVVWDDLGKLQSRDVALSSLRLCPLWIVS